MISQEQVKQYNDAGFCVVRGMFTPEEVCFYREHFESMRRAEHPELAGSLDDTGNTPVDPLKIYPRLMMPHRRDGSSLAWLIDTRLNQVMTTLLGTEPYAVQTMFYFKPAGARGQALHQDQYYLRVQPGTCMAAWMAVDDCDEENGCLQVVPGSHTWPLLCTVAADTSQSFTDVTVPLPDGVEAHSVLMWAGDVLFFNGQIVHGSLPNRSKDRFRRALIGHYIVGEAEKVYRSYKPVLRMDGSEIDLGDSEGGGTCGVWVEQDGQPDGEPVLELQAENPVR